MYAYGFFFCTLCQGSCPYVYGFVELSPIDILLIYKYLDAENACSCSHT